MEEQPTNHSFNSTSELIERLRQIEDDLPDDLHQQILIAGPAIVPAWIGLVKANLQDPEKDGQAATHAARLLGELGDERAIPVLLDCLVECDILDWLYEAAMTALVGFGSKALEPCLLHYQSIQDDERRNFFGETLSKLGLKDDRIFTILVEILHRVPDLGAMYLAHYADPDALPVLLAKFDELPIEGEESFPLANQVFIELKAAIEDLGGSLNAEQQEKYRTGLAVRERLADQLFPRIESFEPTPSGEPLEAATLPGTYQPIKGAKKLGRNDLCWCGSGKKYKKCHLPLER